MHEKTALQRPELLIPVGGREQLDAALLYGADAVFLSGKELSLRAQCEGFDMDGLAQAVHDAHDKNVQVFYCINAMPHSQQLKEVEEILQTLPEIGIDALIIADPGVLWLAKKHCPNTEIHLSTQAHSVNSAAVHFWQEQGVKRINLARELNKDEINQLIQEFPNMQFEIFVHGSMCLALSGHCLLSAWANKRSANLGLCTQPCRFQYRGKTLTNSAHPISVDLQQELSLSPTECITQCTPHTENSATDQFANLQLTVEEKKRIGEDFLDVQQGEDFSALFSPSDLCLVRHMPDLLAMNPTSLKIEGRTKSASYVAQVTDIYRTAIDYHAYKMGIEPKNPRIANYQYNEQDFVDELLHTASRKFSTGFFLQDRLDENTQPNFVHRPIVAIIDEQIAENTYSIHVKCTWDNQCDASILMPAMQRPLLLKNSYHFTNHKGEITNTVHPGLHATIHLQNPIPNIQKGLYIRA